MKISKILGLLAVTTAQNSTEITTTVGPNRALSKLKNVVDTMTTWIEIELIEYKEDFQINLSRLVKLSLVKTRSGVMIYEESFLKSFQAKRPN